MDLFDENARLLDKELDDAGQAMIKKIERMAKKHKRVVFSVSVAIGDDQKWRVRSSHGPLPIKTKKMPVVVATGMGLQINREAKNVTTVQGMRE